MIGLDVIKENIQFILLLALWTIFGAFMGPIVYLFIPITLLLIFLNNRSPEILLGFLFILVLSDSIETQMVFAKSFKNIYILLIFTFFLLSLKELNFFSRIYIYFIPYLIFGIIGLMYSPVFSTSLQKLISYTVLFITIPNFVLRSYEKQGSYFFRNLVFFLSGMIIIGFLLRFYNVEIAFSHGGRFRGVFGNPNGLGIFIMLTFIVATISYYKFPNLFTRTEALIFFLIMFYFVYRTGSRTALLAIVLFFLFNKLFKISPFIGFITFISLLVSIEYLILFFPKLIVFLGMEDSLRLETLEQGSGRLIAWSFAWQNINDSIIIGKGFAYDEYLMRKNFDMLSKAGHEGGVHNTYLIMWLNTGLLGLLSFFTAFITMFIKGAKYNSFAFPAMFAIMLSINFEPWLASSLNPYTILFLIIITILTEDIFNAINDESDEMENVAEVG